MNVDNGAIPPHPAGLELLTNVPSIGQVFFILRSAEKFGPGDTLAIRLSRGAQAFVGTPEPRVNSEGSAHRRVESQRRVPVPIARAARRLQVVLKLNSVHLMDQVRWAADHPVPTSVGFLECRPHYDICEDLMYPHGTAVGAKATVASCRRTSGPQVMIPTARIGLSGRWVVVLGTVRRRGRAPVDVVWIDNRRALVSTGVHFEVQVRPARVRAAREADESADLDGRPGRVVSAMLGATHDVAVVIVRAPRSEMRVDEMVWHQIDAPVRAGHRAGSVASDLDELAVAVATGVLSAALGDPGARRIGPGSLRNEIVDRVMVQVDRVVLVPVILPAIANHGIRCKGMKQKSRSTVGVASQRPRFATCDPWEVLNAKLALCATVTHKAVDTRQIACAAALRLVLLGAVRRIPRATIG